MRYKIIETPKKFKKRTRPLLRPKINHICRETVALSIKHNEFLILNDNVVLPSPPVLEPGLDLRVREAEPARQSRPLLCSMSNARSFSKFN